jgi:hypothetical protein
MDYDSFRTAWTNALWKSGLRRIDLHPTETVDLRTMDRSYETVIEPLGGQDAKPFHVMAKLAWTWDALSNTRGWVGDERVLKEMIGREAAAEMPTERCFVRVDFELSASAPYGHPLVMPPPPAWRKWARETLQRLQSTEPLVPGQAWRETPSGAAEVLAWQDAPKVTATCMPDGELRLEGVQTAAWQLVEVPRAFAEGNVPHAPMARQLTESFARLRAALAAWMQSLDHLRAGSREWKTASDDEG